MFHCLVANRFSQKAQLVLQQNKIINTHIADTLGELKEHWKSADGLIVRSRSLITAELLEKFPKLKVIVTATSGFDHIDLKACQTKNIRVMFTPDANAQSAAELTWALLLASQRKLIPARKHIETENWKREALIGRELSGQTLSLIGFGRIGQRVAKMAQAFDMNIFVHDPYVEQTGFSDVNFVGFEEAIRNADIASFHVPLTTETRHMIKASTLEWFHDKATLINTSRGNVICMDSLLQHLNGHPNFYVGLDVFPSEPLARDSALLQFANVVTTPHVGASTEEALEKASLMAAEKLINFVENGSISDELPPKALWVSKIKGH